MSQFHLPSQHYPPKTMFNSPFNIFLVVDGHLGRGMEGEGGDDLPGKAGEARILDEDRVHADLRDAAQQTRISINYLKALEDEDFSKVPGEVSVRP